MAIVCTAATLALGQQGVPTQWPSSTPTDAGFTPPTSVPEPTLASYSTAEESGLSLAEQVSELQAWREGMAASEAKAKAKAAGKPSLAVGGRLYMDTAMFSQNAASVAQTSAQAPPDIAQNGMELRTARLHVRGTAFDVLDYKLQFDFSSSHASMKDAYITFNELPCLGHVRVGHMKEPFGMEQLISSRFTTFMERSLGDEFTPGRNMGVMAFDCSENQRSTWAIGVFASEQSASPLFVQDDNGNTAMTMRMTYLPWYDEATEGRGLFHTGMAYSYRTIGDGGSSFSTGPEAHLAPDIVSLADGPTDSYHLLGAELAYVRGPFSIQSEYFGVTTNGGAAPSVNLNGCYVNFSYFLTGESRTYSRTAGTFTRIKPFENFFRVCDADGCVQSGMGAWEVAYRASHIDLDDGPLPGGRALDHTLGVNWYLNPYTRIMANYVHSTTDNAVAENGVINAFMMRAQMDF